MHLPMKFRLLQLIAAEPGVTSVALAERVAAEYRGERQARRAVVEDHLVSMQTVGIVLATPKAVDAGGSLIQEYVLTPYGAQRLRFLPRRYRS